MLSFASYCDSVAAYLDALPVPSDSLAGAIVRDWSRRLAPDLWRPALTLWACEACGGDPSQALPVAAAIEYFHRFLVLHEELGDDDLRDRGHAVATWGLGQSLNAGDALYALGFQLLAGGGAGDAPHRLRAAGTIVRGVLGAVEARQAHRITGVLTGAAAQAGAELAGASEDLTHRLDRAGRLLGIAATVDGERARRISGRAIACADLCGFAQPYRAAFGEAVREARPQNAVA